jgi:hypothetical protein
VKTSLSFAFILITVLLFWVGMVQTKSESEKINQSILQSNGSLVLRSDNNRPEASLDAGKVYKEKIKASRHFVPSSLLSKEMSTAKVLCRAKQIRKKDGFDPRVILEMHRRVLDGKLFLDRLTTMIGSSDNAKELLLDPFLSKSLKIKHDTLTRSLFSITVKDFNGSTVLEVVTRAKTPRAAKLLGELIRQAHALILEEESPEAPVFPIVAEYGLDLRRKEAEIEELREQIQQRQSDKPIATVEEISLRAERDQCEKELAEQIDILSSIRYAREKGASIEKLAGLSALSTKGDLADFSIAIKQLREARNSGKVNNDAFRQELDRKINSLNQKMETELTQVITSLKNTCADTAKKRDEVRALLVQAAKENFSESKYEPRFKLLEIRENEVEVLRNRYEVTKSKWQEAKSLLVMDNGQALARD